MGGNTGKSEQELYQEGCDFFSAGDYGHAVVRLLGLADQGHYGAQYCMGVMYHKGLGMEPSGEDLKLAREYLIQSARQGCQESRIYMEQCFPEVASMDWSSAGAGDGQTRFAGAGEGQTVGAGWSEAGQSFTGGQENQAQPGEDLYRQGGGAYKSSQFQMAAWYFDQAARQGHVSAQFELAEMYQRGLGVEANEESACYWYDQAARQGHAGAKERLENREETGLQGSENEQDDSFWTEEDYLQMGIEYAKSGDQVQGAYFVLQAAEMGLLEAQTMLGSLYEFGKGVEEDKGKAALWYGKAAERGDAQAQFRLGYLYEMGEGVEEDEAQAVEWFEKAAAQGSEDARQALQMIRSGEDEDWETASEQNQSGKIGGDWQETAGKNRTEYQESPGQNSGGGRPWLPMRKPEPDPTYMSNGMIELLEKNSEDEVITLAHKYLSAGLDLFDENDKDYLKCIRISAELGCPEAQDMLGLLYARGVDLERDLHRAREWTRRAIQNGNEESRKSLAENMGPEGRMTEKEIYDEAISRVNAGDYETGIPYMREAAYMGCAPALNFLGLIMLQQENPNVDLAIAYLEKGAAQEPVAQDFLGKFYLDGTYTEKNIPKCLYWSEKAAKGGQTASMVRLATLYMSGEDVEEDWGKAASLLQKAADAGDANAQRALGGMYLVGQYVRQDQKTGLFWLKKAADQGDKLAREILDKF